jgi:DNA-binding NtrC family response regulator
MPKTKILLVEDEPAVRDLCAAVLRHYDFDPIITDNGLAGLQVYQERHEEISLVLSDVTMPHMSGTEMARNIFALHSHANVILMSGYGLKLFQMI